MAFVDDLPSKSQIFEHWKDRFEELGFFIDWGEPECWACGFCYDGKYDVRRSNSDWNDVLARWDKIPLQRCHIVPRSLGGSNEASNLFLMCRECHDLAPDTSIPDLFLEWARAQSWLGREATKIKLALQSFGVGEDAFDTYSELIRSRKFKEWISSKVGIHRPQSNYAPRSSRLKFSTIVGLAVEYRRVHTEKK